MLLTPINKISHSKEALILYGRVQGFTIELSTVCLYKDLQLNLAQCVCTGYMGS